MSVKLGNRNEQLMGLRIGIGVIAAFGLLLGNVDGVTSSAMDEETVEAEVAQPQARPVRLMSAAMDKYYRDFFPRVVDPEIQSLLDDERLILYTDREMPKTYQDWDGSLQGVHSADYNISADGGEPFGNANHEFPWGTPAGTHRASNVSSVKFLRLPLDEQGQTLPVVWYRKHYRGDSQAGYAWTFPVGTVLGEVLRQRGPDGKDYTFELRIRVRERGDWAVDVFRPFPTAESLIERIKELRPQWEENETLVKMMFHLETPFAMTKMRLVDYHPRLSFSQSMGVDRLPPLNDPDLVARLLLTTPFQSASGKTWRYGTNDVWTCAPTTKAAFHIIPADYDAGFIEVNRFSCARCHATVGMHANDFEFGRDWYGRVRGSDGIFSFHPFALSSVSYNGMGVSVSMRAELVNAGVLQRYNPAVHTNDNYNKVVHMRN